MTETFNRVYARLLHDFGGECIIHQAIVTKNGMVVLANCNTYERCIHFDREALGMVRTSVHGDPMCGGGNSMIVG